MWDWIKAYKVAFYETFWSILGMKEYEFIYKTKVSDELRYILDNSKENFSEEEIKQIINEKTKQVMMKASIHFGQPYFNTATMAGLYRMMLKEVASSLSVDFPKHPENNKSWWVDYMFN